MEEIRKDCFGCAPSKILNQKLNFKNNILVIFLKKN